MEPLYTEFKTGKAKDLQSIAVHLVRSAPYVVAGIISIANDAPDELEKAKRLPTMVQVRAVTEILKLTCNSVAEVKKMLADVLEGLESTNEILTTTQGMLPSPVEGDPIP